MNGTLFNFNKFLRLHVVQSTHFAKNRDLRPTYVIVFMSFFVSFIWSILPALGWSSYKREGLMSNCNIDWNEKSLNNLSYFVVVWTLDFIVPLVCIFKCLFGSLYLVKIFNIALGFIPNEVF
jgi:hypothetical protein